MLIINRDNPVSIREVFDIICEGSGITGEGWDEGQYIYEDDDGIIRDQDGEEAIFMADNTEAIYYEVLISYAIEPDDVADPFAATDTEV